LGWSPFGGTFTPKMASMLGAPVQRFIGLFGVVAPSTAIGGGPTPPLAPARVKVGHPMCTPKP
jgi:hypothetical protein